MKGERPPESTETRGGEKTQKWKTIAIIATKRGQREFEKGTG